MFLTLISQYLNKPVEGKVRDLSPPQSLHTIDIQSLGRDGIKPLAQVGGKFPVPITPLVANMSMKTCKLTHTPPPVARTFNFTRKTFVEFSECFQGLFQELWRLYFLAITERQKRVFHTEVCTNAFTCCLQRFGIYVVGCQTKPIVTARVAFQGNPSDLVSLPLAMFEKGIPHAILFPFSIAVFSERHCDTIIGYFPTRRPRKRNRLEFVSRLDMRLATQFLEKALIRRVNAFQLRLHGLRRQSLPMWMRGSLAFRQVRSHSMIVGIRKPVFIALTLPLMEVFMHLPHIIKQVTKSYQIRLIAEFVFVSFQGFTSTSLYPRFSGKASTSPSGDAETACQLVIVIIPQFILKVKFILAINPYAVYILNLKEGVLTEE